MRYAAAVLAGFLAIATFPSDAGAKRGHREGRDSSDPQNLTTFSHNVVCIAIAYMGVAKADCQGRHRRG